MKTFRMWTTLALVVGLVGASLGAVATTPDTPLEGNAWALLVAGSKGWVNYRHQADICHSYHLMISEGIRPERIIVMMYDDIAFNPENPHPGVIINKPNGINVYPGVKIDYKGEDVTPHNFLNVLSGNKYLMEGIGTGRVIESDNSTNVFVYFADHGGYGCLGFPSSLLSAHRLENTLRKMNEESRYNKIIMYIEACQSGSVFENILPEDKKVYVMTAADRDESSWGCYCDSHWHCLGDEFSVRWMERIDGEGQGTFDQFFHQYQQLRPLVRKSHIQIYGDFSIGTNAMTPNKNKPGNFSKNDLGKMVSSRDVPLYYYLQRVINARDFASLIEALQDFGNLVEGRRIADEVLEKLVTLATIDAPHHRSTVNEERLPLSLDVFPCYENLIENFKSYCFEHKHEYLLQHYYKFANLCILGLDTSRLLKEMPAVCAPHKAELKSTVL